MLFGLPVDVLLEELEVTIIELLEEAPEEEGPVCAALLPRTDMPLTKKMSANIRLAGMIHF
jgi:hypothetical protein